MSSAASAKGGRLPDFLVIGAMRSGTTSLYRYLAAHPEIFMVPKELQFFTEHFDKGLEWYGAQFTPAGEDSVLGEATADYLARESAMTRIADTVPDVKLIASLRNPVDRAWSHYGLLRERGRESRSFTDVLDEELDLIDRFGPGARGVLYLAHGLYDVHLERLFRLFDRGRVHVSIFERMINDPQRSYEELCRFVGVDSSFVPKNLGQPVNPFVAFRSITVRNLGRRLPGPLAAAVARLNTRRGPPKAMADSVRSRLEWFYARRVRRIETLLGEPIPEWGLDD